MACALNWKRRPNGLRFQFRAVYAAWAVGVDILLIDLFELQAMDIVA